MVDSSWRNEAKRIEEEGDAVYHEMQGRLFDTETDPVTLVKWKEVFRRPGMTIVQAENVANAVGGVLQLHSSIHVWHRGREDCGC